MSVQSGRRVTLVWLLVAAIVAVAVAWTVQARRTVEHALEAEHNFQSFAVVSAVIGDHIKRHGSWPTSEKDLAQVAEANGHGRDFSVAIARVNIVYGVRLTGLTTHEDLVRVFAPKDPTYTAVDRYSKRLLDTIQRHRDRR